MTKEILMSSFKAMFDDILEYNNEHFKFDIKTISFDLQDLEVNIDLDFGLSNIVKVFKEKPYRDGQYLALSIEKDGVWINFLEKEENYREELEKINGKN